MNAWIPAPSSVGDKAYALKGGCACDDARSGARIPCVVYERDGSLIALLAVDRARLDPAVLDRAVKSVCGARPVYYYRLRDTSVLICPSGGTAHVWVSNLAPETLCKAVQATPEGRLAIDGIRIRIEDMTCEMCCSGVREALAAVPGVKQVAVDMTSGEAQVLAESPDLAVSTLVEALTRAGYRASPAQ
jgi:copper chaperone CopZ